MSTSASLLQRWNIFVRNIPLFQLQPVSAGTGGNARMFGIAQFFEREMVHNAPFFHWKQIVAFFVREMLHVVSFFRMLHWKHAHAVRTAPPR
jgi:hypothetical protein